MKKNDNSSKGAFVISLTFAVVVFTAIYIQHQSTRESVVNVETPVLDEKVLAAEPEIAEVIYSAENELLEEEIATPEPPAVISFAKAYSIAREALGSGQTFTWNGTQYSTNTAEEAASQIVTDEPENNLTDSQDSLGSTLSHAITP
ncbi:MAG: hypothetical protein H8E70_07265 [Candidatus Marinimicrobia bacterium]|nr:hypothetical protein [Candidatus Neomarinimicrobiota bacterium]